MKGKLWRCLLTVLTAMCICFGFAACDEGQPSEKQPLAAPQDVKIEENILSWKAVEGAEKYTVKINDDETTEVSAATLDLNTVTAKLTEGENTLSVKANETKEKAASPYSQAVKYTYAPPPAVHTHTLSKHDAKDATCTEAGNTLYYECSGCGKFFSDDKGEHEVKEDSWVVAATGHSYGDPEWAWTGDETNGYTAATATFSCENCTDKQVKTATVTHATTTPAACTTTGTKTYTATVEFEEETYTDTKTATLAATGHSYGDPEWAWTGDETNGYTAATATFACENCTDEQVKTATVTHSTTTPAACTTTGTETYTATVKFEEETYTDTKTATLAAKGHSYGDPEWAWTGDDTNGYTTATATFSCENCTDKQVKTATVTHATTTPAACTTTGTETYTATVEFEEETYTATKTATLAAKGHSYGAWAITAPSATDKGKAVKTCANCEEGTEGHTLEKELPVLGDENYQKTADTATCTQTGEVTYTITLDGETFSFKVTTPALNHNWATAWTTENGKHWHACTRCGEKNEEAACEYNKPVFTWTTDYTSATAAFTCKTCSDEQTQPATVESETTEEPSCTDKGVKTYTAEVTFGGATYSEKKTEDIPATGHSYGDPTWAWQGNDETGYTSATATFTCENCDDTQTRNADAVKTEVEEGCVKKDTYTVTVEFEGEHYSDEPKEVTTAGQHTYNSATWAWAPSDDGYTATLTLKCGVCQNEEELKATVTSSTTKEPSCTEFGEKTYTATVEFEEQTYTSTKSVPIFPTPHTYGDEPKWTWTEDDNGGYTAKATFTCTECKTQTLEVDATVSEPDIKNATCTEEGSKTYTATVTVEFGKKEYTDKKTVMNVFNEWHAANTSKKIRAVLKSNAREGKYHPRKAPYGYIKGNDDKRTPIIDEEAAAVVKRIFEMRSRGMSPHRIADQLNEEGIASPSKYCMEKYGVIGKRNNFGLWSVCPINSILKNPTYLGHMVQQRWTSVSYKNHARYLRDESEWVIVKNTHEAIISQELWDKVREVEQSVAQGRKTKRGYTHPLSGFLYCADCGGKMKLNYIKRNGGLVYNFNCGNHIRLGKAYCFSHHIAAKDLEEIILGDIRSMAQRVTLDEQEIREAFIQYHAELEERAIKSSQKELKAKQKRHGELSNLMQAAYEDKVRGKIPEGICVSFIEKYSAEQKSLAGEIEELERRLSETETARQNADDFIRDIKKYLDAPTLTREMCYELIDRIIIGGLPKVTGKERTIEIVYKVDIASVLRDRFQK